MTLRPVASWKVRVTGMLPPSRVRSGSTPKTVVKKIQRKAVETISKLRYYRTQTLYRFVSFSLITCFHGFPTSHVVWVVEVRDPGLGSVTHAHFHFVGTFQLCKFLLHIIQNLPNEKKKEISQEENKTFQSVEIRPGMDFMEKQIFNCNIQFNSISWQRIVYGSICVAVSYTASC